MHSKRSWFGEVMITAAALLLALGGGGCSSVPSAPPEEGVRSVAQPLTGGPLALLPLDQNSESALVTGISTEAPLTLTRNGSTLYSTSGVSDLLLRFGSAATAPSGLGNLNDSVHVYAQGNFSGGTASELMAYNGSSGAWYLGSLVGAAFTWTQVATHSFGSLNDGNHSTWVADFTGANAAELLVYSSSDNNWWLGTLSGTTLSWTNVANTASLGFGSLSNSAMYVNVADFLGIGHRQVLINSSSTGNWWLGSVSGKTMSFPNAGHTSFNSFHDGFHAIWTGNFQGGSSQKIMFYNTSNFNWYFGSVQGSTTSPSISWSSLGNQNIGNILDSTNFAAFVGNFTGSSAQVLIYSQPASDWMLAQPSGSTLSLQTVATATAWGNPSDANHYFAMGSFDGSGQKELIFYNGANSPGPFWRWGHFTGASTLTWNSGSAGWVGPLNDGTRMLTVGKFSNLTRDEVVFYYSGDGHWFRIGVTPGGDVTGYLDAETRGLGNLIDASHFVVPGAWGGGVTQLLAYGSAGTGTTWVGSFDAAKIALGPALVPGDTVVASSGSQTSTVTVANDYTTEHYNNVRSGLNAFESKLTAANVMAPGTTFGIKATYNVSNKVPEGESGQVYAQPLVVHGVSIGGAVHNVVYVATEADQIFAFDAAAVGNPAPLLSRTLLLPGDSRVLWTDDQTPSGFNTCANLYPTVGVTGTPVIDAASGTMYVVARAEDSSGQFYIRLHALDVTTLQDRANSPTEILYNGTYNSNFELGENQRSALLLEQGTVWVTFAGHCDNAPYAGAVFGFDAVTLDQTFDWFAAPYDTTAAKPGGAGIWSLGVGPSAVYSLGASTIYFATGNPQPFEQSNVGQFDDSIVGITWPGQTVTPWNPSQQTRLFDSQNDLDVGASGVVILPGNAMLVGGKQGYLYAVDSSTFQTLSQVALYTDGAGNPLLANQSPCGDNEPGAAGAPTIHLVPTGAEIYTHGGVCNASFGGKLERFLWNSTTKQLSLSAAASSVYVGLTMVGSSNADVTGTHLLWFVNSTPPGPTNPQSLLTLVIYNMEHVASQSEVTFPLTGEWTNANGGPFIEPTVMDGRVYVGFGGGVNVFSL